MHPLIHSPEDLARLILERQTNITRMRISLHRSINPRYRPVDRDARKAQLAMALHMRYSLRLARRAVRALKENFDASL